MRRLAIDVFEGAIDVAGDVADAAVWMVVAPPLWGWTLVKLGALVARDMAVNLVTHGTIAPAVPVVYSAGFVAPPGTVGCPLCHETHVMTPTGYQPHEGRVCGGYARETAEWRR
jgi:hypothetical protein